MMQDVSQNEIVSRMSQEGLIPVFNHTDISIAKKVLDACYNGGVRVFEFTNRGSNALEVFESLVDYGHRYPDLLLGIGTIFSKAEAKKFYEKGAKFIVSPAMIPEMAEFCKTVDIPWIPGCGTVTEIHNALHLGAKIVKAFPGNVLSPGFVKAVKAVYPNVPVMPTGGVAPTEENLKAWFNAGVTCVGMGSQLIKKDAKGQLNYSEIESLTSKAIQIISNLRTS